MGNRRLTIGYYMFTPAIGGAEVYLRDLLARLDRDRFTPVAFLEPWAPLEEFLGLRDGIARYVPVPVKEFGGHRAAKTTPVGDAARSALPSTVRDRLRPRAQRIRNHRWALHNLRVLRRAFAETPVDILHVNNGGYPGAWTARAAAAVARAIGVGARVMTVAGTPSPPRREQPFPRLLDATVRRSVNVFVTVAHGLRDELVGRFAFDASRVEVIPYGVPAPSLSREPARVALRGRIGAAADALVVGYVGRVSEEKGPDTFLRMLAPAAARSGQPVHAVVAGSGPLLDQVRQRAAASLALPVTLLGQLAHDDAVEVTAGLDVLVLPSRTEGLPYAVSEAMSLSVPVVAFAVGGVPDQVVNGHTGRLAAPGDEEALVAALAEFLADEPRRRRMGESAETRFRERFTIERMIEAHEDLYERLAARTLH